MKVLIATQNPGKIEGVTLSFSRYYNDVEVIGIPAQSDVKEEPVNSEIYLGAKNRVKNLKIYAQENNIEADLFVAVESGITDSLGRWMIINIAVIEDNLGFESYGTSPAFPVPDKYVDEIIRTDLGQVMDKIFNETELRKGKGGINFLTHDVISRIDLTETAFIMALTKYINKEIWN